MRFLVVFITMHHQCMVMNHLKLIIYHFALMMVTDLEPENFFVAAAARRRKVISIRHFLHHRLGESK
jgi:hypothetical protein